MFPSNTYAFKFATGRPIGGDSPCPPSPLRTGADVLTTVLSVGP
jgi:hypothetical protein